jgi:predicted NBD/HSP70 family sugar kinase
MVVSGVQAEPASTERLRRQNVSLVLRSLRREGPATRTELAQRTGLAKATVGVIVGDLERSRAVVEEESRAGARGRPGRPVALRGDRFLALGLELNVDYVAAVLLDLAGEIRMVETRPTPLAVLGREQALLDLVEEVILPTLAGRVLVGVTLAVPGLVRADNRTVAWAPNVPLRGESLVQRLERVLGGRCRIRVSNDANCAAYAETHHGAATDSQHVLYLTGTVGIGAGIVESGQLVRGATGFAGEVGHMPVGDPDALCGCGRRGCWEASIGLHAMLDAVGMTELTTPLDTARAVATRALTDASVRAGLARPGRAHPGARPGRRGARGLLRAAGRPGPRAGPPHARRAARHGHPAPARPPARRARHSGRGVGSRRVVLRRPVRRRARPVGLAGQPRADVDQGRAERGDRVDEEWLERHLGRPEQH